MQDENAKAALERRDRDYHARHAAEAMQILRDLKAAGTALRRPDIRRCEEYSADIFHDKKYAPWLLVYSAISGGFREGWIPDNFYGSKVVPAIQGRHGHISFLKSLSGALFKGAAFPDIGSRINGSLFDRDYCPLSFEEAHAQFFDGNERVVFKPDSSGRGKGIQFFDAQSFDRAAVDRLGGGVFQRCVSHHPLFDRFTDKAVAAIRITTVVEVSGEITARAAYLCMAKGADTHVHSQSRLRVPLDIATGALRETGRLANWLECTAHPTSGEPFAGKTIPAFDNCLRTVVAHHRRIPFVGAVGWDVTVDRDEQVQILEWNGYHNGIGFAEATEGPCFTDLRWERFA